MSGTSKKQVIVGSEEYINSKTGEVEKFNVVKQYDQDFNFQKLWLGHILESLDIIGNKKIKVLNWLLANKDNNNQVIGTQRVIAKKANVSLQLVNETLKMLQLSNLLKKKQQGVYILNPEVIFQGSNSKRMNILLKYSQVETIETEQKKLDFENKK